MSDDGIEKAKLGSLEWPAGSAKVLDFGFTGSDGLSREYLPVLPFGDHTAWDLDVSSWVCSKTSCAALSRGLTLLRR